MSNAKKYIDLEHNYSADIYSPLPVVINHGSGSKVYDVDGKEYIDLHAGYSALNLGHRHPRLLNRARDQLDNLTMTSRAFSNDILPIFLAKLSKFTGYPKSIVMNTGAEAVETAIKIARRWGQKNKEDKHKFFVVADNNFHGRTTTIVGFSSSEESQRGFGPFTNNVLYVPFGDTEEFEHLLQSLDGGIIAIMIEPIQGEAGVIVPNFDYLRKIRALCNKYNVLMILDEIQSGMGRTGRLWAWEHEGFAAKPDLMIIGKSLGGGIMPVSAVMGSHELMELMTYGSHGSTFGGMPLAAAVASEVIDIYEQEDIVRKAVENSIYLAESLDWIKDLDVVKGVRYIGMWGAIDLHSRARPWCEAFARKGVLCKETRENTVRIAPPLNIHRDDLREGLNRIYASLRVDGDRN
jgi:ornithine--oxo-acid transaminase